MGMNDRYVDNSEYNDFLEQLVQKDCLEGPSHGITKQVIDKGEESLNKKQLFVFKKHVLDAYTKSDCDRCGNNFQWSEMYDAVTEHGLCSYCLNIREKMMNE
jgi:NAD-dependent SIR2 family protein deacetylase